MSGAGSYGIVRFAGTTATKEFICLGEDGETFPSDCWHGLREILAYHELKELGLNSSPELLDFQLEPEMSMTMSRHEPIYRVLNDCDGAPSEDIRQEWVLQLLQHVRANTAAGMYTCDIKPGNCVIRKSDNALLIVDWGLLRTRAHRLQTLDSSYAYTDGFRSPFFNPGTKDLAACELWAAAATGCDIMGWAKEEVIEGKYVESHPSIGRTLQQLLTGVVEEEGAGAGVGSLYRGAGGTAAPTAPVHVAQMLLLHLAECDDVFSFGSALALYEAVSSCFSPAETRNALLACALLAIQLVSEKPFDDTSDMLLEAAMSSASSPEISALVVRAFRTLLSLPHPLRVLVENPVQIVVETLGPHRFADPATVKLLVVLYADLGFTHDVEVLQNRFLTVIQSMGAIEEFLDPDAPGFLEDILSDNPLHEICEAWLKTE